jgi:hypothetical protein
MQSLQSGTMRESIVAETDAATGKRLPVRRTLPAIAVMDSS